MYARQLELAEITQRKSVLLLGPRQTGKSTLLRSAFPGAPTYNLLDSITYRSLSADPALIRKELAALPKRPPIVVIDEVQRLPELLNEAHLLIEETGQRFVLTGSSARALRRRGVNLLGGRARTLHLNPLVSHEIGPDFDLVRAVNHGLLPAIYDSDVPDADLADYAGVYLREEVAAEGLSRNVSGFARFLEVAALCSGTMLNATKIATDAQVKRTTVLDWFDVLRDTLLAHDLPAWTKTKDRRAIKTSKLYLFDLGVTRHLAAGPRLEPRTPAFGAAFEHFLFHELRSACDYGRHSSLSYWRSTSGFEVDFVLDERVAIGAKASKVIGPTECRGLRALRSERLLERFIVVSLVEQRRIDDGIEIWPWREFLSAMWAGELANRPGG